MDIDLGKLSVKFQLHSFHSHRFETNYFLPTSDRFFPDISKFLAYPNNQFLPCGLTPMKRGTC